MREKASETLFDSKKNRLKRTLDWVEKHCNKQQKSEVNEIIDQYAYYLVAFPDVKYIRCSHEIDDKVIKTPITKEELPDARRSPDYSLQQEIENRKKLVNGLIMEIEELKELRGSTK